MHLRFGSVLDRLGVTKAHHRIDEYGGMWYEGKRSIKLSLEMKY